MKIYAVGGSCRNEIMGLPVKDRDYVVVGTTAAEMIARGFRKVGADFPVFLSPDGDEYALARRERSTGAGYNDFTVEFDPGVTIEEDLLRRDLTVNAIARDLETGAYVDPYGGRDDIRGRVLRIVQPDSFEEDPVRILRAARLLAEYPAFSVEPRTFEAARRGDVGHCTAERIALELQKTMKAAKPSRFFDFLHGAGQLGVWLPEVEALVGVPQVLKHHMEGDAYVHTMIAVDAAARAGEPPEVVFGCLVHDLGKAVTPPDLLPAHHGHEEAGVPLVESLCRRLKLEGALLRIGVRSAEFHTKVHNLLDLNPKTIVRIYESFKSHLGDADVVGRVAFYDNEAKLPHRPYGDNHRRFPVALKALSAAKLSARHSPDEIAGMSIESRRQAVHKMRLDIVRGREPGAGDEPTADAGSAPAM